MKISVIIPVYNEKKFLKDCVKSIVNQDTNLTYEIILVDDGSNNGAQTDCDEIALNYSNVRVFHQKNQGLSASRLNGLKYAQGEWIMFMDHDDIVSPHILSNLSKYFYDDEVDIICGGRIDSSNPEQILWNHQRSYNIYKMVGREVTEYICFDREQKLVTTPLWGKLFRRSFLQGLDLYKYRDICPTIFFEDVLMAPILYNEARFVCILDEQFYIHREVKTSISRSGKLSNFYFEQIFSGDILLIYCSKRELSKYYSYQLGIYLRSIIRIYCLMDNYLEKNECDRYRKLIIEKFRNYYKDFHKIGFSTKKEKLIIELFNISPTIIKLCYKY